MFLSKATLLALGFVVVLTMQDANPRQSVSLFSRPRPRHTDTAVKGNEACHACSGRRRVLRLEGGSLRRPASRLLHWTPVSGQSPSHRHCPPSAPVCPGDRPWWHRALDKHVLLFSRRPVASAGVSQLQILLILSERPKLNRGAHTTSTGNHVTH